MMSKLFWVSCSILHLLECMQSLSNFAQFCDVFIHDLVDVIKVCERDLYKVYDIQLQVVDMQIKCFKPSLQLQITTMILYTWLGFLYLVLVCNM
jgi:hypothetical protein